MTFFQELRRRNVFRVGIAYALAAWVLLQGVDFVLDLIKAPDWILQVFALAAAVGLPVVLIFSWVFEMTPEGLKRESQIDRDRSITPVTGRKLDRVIIVFLALAVVALLADRLVNHSREHPAESTQVVQAEPESSSGEIPASQEALRSVAVLPFAALSSGPDDEYFADGLTEEILNSLAQLPELLVTARTSAFHFKGQDLPVQEIAAKLGVAHIVEGSVRRAGERLRVTAQLVRAADGFHLWSENYDSSEEDTIAVQEEIAEKIALALDVVLDDTKREAMSRAGLRDVEAFVELQKGVEWYERAHGEADQLGALRQANRHFETVIARVPDYPLAYELHSDLYIHLLLNDATGQSLDDIGAEEIATAGERVAADLQAAADRARTPQERNGTDLDLAYLSSDWRGMPARIERLVGEQGCSGPTWIPNIGVPFGYAAQLNGRFTEYRNCDPLRSTAWVNEARSLLWSGDPDGALAVARRGVEVAPGDWLAMQLINALLARGEFETAEHEISIAFQDRFNVLAWRMMAAAAKGDREAAAARFQEYLADPGSGPFTTVAYHAWTGDIDQANRLAAVIDAHPFAGPSLTTVILWCACGAPWDLAATPHFARLVDDAGFSWPPPSPIKFPLKTW
jgi:TolB-like protein